MTDLKNLPLRFVDLDEGIRVKIGQGRDGSKHWFDEDRRLRHELTEGGDRWTRNLAGQLHGEQTMSNGARAWYRNGLLHRTNGPAIEIPLGASASFPIDDNAAIELEAARDRYHVGADGGIPQAEYDRAMAKITIKDAIQAYALDGKLHRKNGPSLVFPDGRQYFALDGKRQVVTHVTDRVGTTRHYDQDGRLHRDDGPAIEFANGAKAHYKRGRLHRDKGPAVEVPQKSDLTFATDTNRALVLDLEMERKKRTQKQAYAKEYAAYEALLIHAAREVDAREGEVFCVALENGAKLYYDGHGGLHRDGDKPAVELANGARAWYRHGRLHRDGEKPAIDAPEDAISKFPVDNRRAEALGHAIEAQLATGTKPSREDKEEFAALHISNAREAFVDRGVPSKIEYQDGRIEYLNEMGLLHREDGPAVKYLDGTEAWYQNGKLHRDDGPAITVADGRGISFPLDDARWHKMPSAYEAAHADIESMTEISTTRYSVEHAKYVFARKGEVAATQDFDGETQAFDQPVKDAPATWAEEFTQTWRDYCDDADAQEQAEAWAEQRGQSVGMKLQQEFCTNRAG
jgi:hypothetical protein